MADKGLRRTDYWNRVTGSVRTGDTRHDESVTDIESFVLPYLQTATAGLHLWGVADGLTVTATPGQQGVTVSPGSAVDAAGHVVALVAGGMAVTDPGIDPDDPANIATVGVDPAGVSVATAGLNGRRYVTARNLEAAVQGLLGNAPTLVHSPWLRLADANGFGDTGDEVVLAQVELTNGAVTALIAGPRRMAGLRAQAAQLWSPTAVAAPGPTVAQAPCAELRARTNGGLDVTVLTVTPPKLALSIDAAGNLGIGLGALQAQRPIHVEGLEVHSGGENGGFSFADRSVGSFIDTPAAGERWVWYAEEGNARLWSGQDRLCVTRGGMVGIGVTGDDVNRPLHVEGKEVHSGGGGGGYSFADRNVGSFVETPNSGQRWIWYAAQGRARLWSGEDLLTVGVSGEGLGLDVSRRMRVRQGRDGSAGIWFFQTGANADRGFVGMSDDTHIGFWGNTGAGWGLTMDTTNGDVGITGMLDTRRRMRVRQGADGSAGIWFFQNGPNADRGFVGMSDDTHIGFWGNTGAGWAVRMDTTTGALEAHGGNGPFQAAVVGKGNIGVRGEGTATGVMGAGNPAGMFLGDVNVTGTLSTGNKQFKIDHPLDPAHKFLQHSVIESDEMKNIYDGVAELDQHGRAEVDLPDWFEALNEKFRYQLTPLGVAAPNLHVDQELSDGRFTIAGGLSHTRVCWLISGVRHDAYAKAHPLHVESVKTDHEAGLYLYPTEHDEPAERSLASLFIDN